MESDPNDLKIAERLRKCDVEVFQDLYRTHKARLSSFLRHYLGDASAAEDVAQEVFLYLWKKPNGFNPGRGTLKGYLFGMARHRGVEWLRQHSSRENPSALEPIEEGVETGLILEQALEKMEPDLRGLLWLREVEGYSYSELSQILEIPMGTVKSRLFAAREDLRCKWHGRRP
ncbi:MAG: sigma-70 family RNA polymerase sigma factor [Acidobacteriia bacterium]|nr:sigma-70 family RNA polymerase sigma factor [Terriglobia bacterium]